jgi:1-acyl-sn-glycerol-3-phosphate acyltransferase
MTRVSYFISRVVYGIILKLFFKFEVIGRENIPRRGPYILAANHVSYADPVIIGVACPAPHVSFIAKRELVDKPFLGAWCRAVGCIFIERYSGSSAPLKKTLKRLKEGGVIGMFPEGRRSRDGNLQKAEPGVGVITARSKAPVIPMYIYGSERALPVGGKFPRPYYRIIVRIGKAVDLDKMPRFSKKRKAYEYIGEEVMKAIRRLAHE